MLDIGIDLARCNDIKFYDICTIHQPTVKEIFDNKDFGYQKYRMLLLPFMINNNYCKLDGINNFDMLFINPLIIPETDGDDEQELWLFPIFVKFIEFFIQEKMDYDNINHSLYFNDDKEKKIDKDNWDEFVDVILKICSEKRLERPSYQEDGLNEKKRELRKKLHKFRNRKNNGLSITDVYFLVQYKMRFTDEEMGNLTMWKLMFYFKTIQEEESWKNNFEISLVGGFGDDKPDMTHWMAKAKI